MNSVSLIGRLAEPPELRVAEPGEEGCAMRVAGQRVARGGTPEAGVVYVEVTTSGWHAREVYAAVEVGERIGVAGRIELEEWRAPDGERHARYEVKADQLELLDARAEPPGPAAAA